MDYLNPCNKNQTAKVLERFFYVSNGREYISVIPDEAERITKLPTLDEVEEDTNRVVTYAKEIILNADKYKDMKDLMRINHRLQRKQSIRHLWQAWIIQILVIYQML